MDNMQTRNARYQTPPRKREGAHERRMLRDRNKSPMNRISIFSEMLEGRTMNRGCRGKLVDRIHRDGI